ncbi:MAG TPA: LytR C-terminal domain-containing protein [Actinomycetota bacterium]|nr:LytR C-terminal domain-containing protein [Actinomycetota bacterium]
MGTGALRLAIVVALVVGGLAVLTRAFPEPGGGAIPTRSPSPTMSPTPTATTPPPRTFEPRPPERIRIAVYNGTFEVGMAGETQQRLEDEGFRAAQEAADWPAKPIARTAVYFVGGGQARADAAFVRDEYFPGARLQRYPADGPELDPQVEVIILIGEDAVQG